jgi:hypothetical protein
MEVVKTNQWRYVSKQFIHFSLGNILKCKELSSQSPTNSLDISYSPHKTYNYVKYIKI